MSEFYKAEDGRIVKLDSNQPHGAGLQRMWTVEQAAEAWDLNTDYARRIIGQAQGAERAIDGRNAIWLVPEGAEKPTDGKPGPKRKKRL